jgi:hypothetical protein
LLSDFGPSLIDCDQKATYNSVRFTQASGWRSQFSSIQHRTESDAVMNAALASVTDFGSKNRPRSINLGRAATPPRMMPRSSLSVAGTAQIRRISRRSSSVSIHRLATL